MHRFIGIAEKIPTGSDPRIDFIFDSMPAIPTAVWAPLYKDATEIHHDKFPAYYDFLSYTTAIKLFEMPHREIKRFISRAPGHIELYNTLKKIFQVKVDKAYNDGRFSLSQKSMCMLMISEAINFLIFADKGATNTRVALLDYLKSEGTDKNKWFDLSLGIQALPNGFSDLKSIKLDSSLYEYFKSNDIQKMISSLENAARIHAMTESEAKDRVNPYSGIIDYYTENILRAQSDGIIRFGKFLKDLAQDLPTDHKVEICPYKTFLDGFAYSTRKNYLDFFPDPKNPNSDQKFELDRDIEGFKDDFIKILGGLLIDHQTFVLSEVDEDGNIVRYYCAFNLLFGALDLQPRSDLNLYVPRPATQYYVSAPEISTFEPSLYDRSNPKSIVNIMRTFVDDELLIGFQRIGDRETELEVFKEICESLMFIKCLF